MALGAAALFSTGGAAIKLCALSGLQVAGLRSAVAAVALALLLPEARRGWDRRVLGVAMAYAGCLVCFAAANKLTTAVHSILLQATAPLYIALLGPWLLGERAGRREWGALAVIAAGMAILVSSNESATSIASHPALGNALALVSGVFWAGTVMGLRWLSQGDGPTAASAALAGNVVAALICLPFAGLPEVVSLSDVAVLGWLGVFQIGLAYLLLTRALPHLTALEAALLLYLEPALSGVWAWWVHGESPGPVGLLGSVVILIGLGWHARGGAASEA